MNDLEKIKKEVIEEQNVCIDANFEGWEVNEIIEDVLKEFIEKLDLPSVKNCVLIETKIQKLIKKLEAENVDRKKELGYNLIVYEMGGV